MKTTSVILTLVLGVIFVELSAASTTTLGIYSYTFSPVLTVADSGEVGAPSGSNGGSGGGSSGGGSSSGGGGY